MKKRLIAIALCLVMVSAFTVTSAVSAASENGPVKQYDLHNKLGAVAGKVTVNFETGYWVANGNEAKISKDAKEGDKGEAGLVLPLYMTKGKPLQFDDATLTVNQGGNVHGEGTVGQDVLDQLSKLGDNAWFWVGGA